MLRVENLGVEIGGRRLLDGVSLTVGDGEILGLVGESGSGKSLTGLSIIGLLAPQARRQGVVTLGEVVLTDLGEGALCAVRGREVGMVFQEPMTALNPIMTIGDQVAEGVRLHRGVSRGEALATARDTLERVGLPPGQFPLGRYPGELSGGQRQRVAIAIAVALRPRLIIADEPTTALDVTTQAQVIALLTSLAREDGAGLILITHDLALAAQVADRIAVMQAGRIVETAETLALFGAMADPYTRALRAASTFVARRPATVAAAPGPPILQAREVVRDYPGARPAPFRRRARIRAVDHVSLSISHGENVGLVGESGCGKSTLLRALLALEAPDGGEVSLDGVDFPASRGQARRRLRRQIQAVFQDPYGSFDPRWTVEELVSEPLALIDERLAPADRRRRVEALLEQVGLAAADADRRPHEFSGGERQRIAIARALISEPAILALDEATSALDVTIRSGILALLAELTARLGVACLFISHDLALVRAITDRVLVMRAGRIVEEGPTEQVFANPRHPYTATLVAATTDLDRVLAQRRASRSLNEADEDK